MRENKRFLWIFLIIFMIFGAIFFQVWEYSKQSKRIIQEQTDYILYEHVETVKNNFLKRMEEQYNSLNAVANYINGQNEFLIDDISTFKQYIHFTSCFDKFGLVDVETGIAEFDQGSLVEVSDEAFFKDSAQGRPSIQCFNSGIGGTSQLVLSIPLYRDGIVTSILIGTFSHNLVEDSIRHNFYDEDSYLYVTDKQGNILSNDQETDLLNGYSNIFAYLDSKTVDTNEIRYRIEKNEISSFMDSSGEEKRFMTYIPLGINEWYLFCSTPDYGISRFTNEFEVLGSNIIFKIILLCVAVCITTYFFIRQATSSIKKEHERFKMAEEVAGMISFEGDYAKDILVVNDNYYKQFGRGPSFQTISDFKKPHPFIIEEDQGVFLKMGLNLIAGKESDTVEFRTICRDGSIQWHQFVYRVWHDRTGAPLKCYGMIVPIDQQMKEISKLQMQVKKDSLTGALNRMAFENNVNLCFEEPELANKRHAMLLLDLDNFKQINDGYGHALGDHALITTTEILRSNVRSSDYVGRLGGDEFVVFLKNANEEQAAKKAAEICEALERAELKSDEAVVTCSIGVACYPKSGISFNQLYEAADEALYKVKGSGKNSYSMAN